MSYSIEQLKGEISRTGGFAVANQYRVVLPVIPEIYTSVLNQPTPRSLNILCKNVTMPGRLLSTIDREIGVVNQKIAYGFINDEITMTFTGMNNYGVRRYLEDWQDYIMNPDTHVVRYKNEYARKIIIQQVNKKGFVTYSIELDKAFPMQIAAVEFSNDNSQPVDIAATFSYTKWRRVEQNSLLPVTL